MTDNIKELSFEEAMKKLEEIVASLENEDIALDKSMALYEEGMKLSKHCDTLLKDAEEKMTKLMNEDGSVEQFENNLTEE